MKILTKSPQDTINFAKDLATRIAPGTLVLLSGELGAGKTQFVKGLAMGFGIKEDVSSPTFVIVNEYTNGVKLFHVDLYRLDSFPLEDLDIDEMLEEGVVAVEWWEKDRNFFLYYKNRIEITIKVVGETEREIEVEWFQ